jgi:thymidylate synthase ThyX
VPEEFTPDERARLTPYFTNVDRHVFALINLPETVKGALFARYSRSAKSLRRLFLDEFADQVTPEDPGASIQERGAGLARAEKLYARVFNEYGDDSVAQLGGAHIACEYVSNILTKVLEWGRLMAYLEQSTRYVPYTDKLDGRWRYHIPEELADDRLRARYVRTMDRTFELYARWIPAMQAYFERRYPKRAEDSDGVHRAAIRA